MAVWLRKASFSRVGLLLVLVGCGPKYPRLPADKAALVGIIEDREADEQNSSVRGTIVRLDGRTVKLMKEEHLDPGCHVVEIEVKYTITRPVDQPCPLEPVFGSLGACDGVAKYESGLRSFAIPMRPGRRYELS